MGWLQEEEKWGGGMEEEGMGRISLGWGWGGAIGKGGRCVEN